MSLCPPSGLGNLGVMLWVSCGGNSPMTSAFCMIFAKAESASSESKATFFGPRLSIPEAVFRLNVVATFPLLQNFALHHGTSMRASTPPSPPVDVPHVTAHLWWDECRPASTS
eukprot:7212895-Pyramimonas_sp.AAC.1